MSSTIDAALEILQRTGVKDLEQNVKDISILLQSSPNNHNNKDDDDDEDYEDDNNTITTSATKMKKINDATVEEFTNLVDTPLHSSSISTLTSTSTSTSDKQYIQSDYNSEQQSFRSPWTNEYYPPLAKLTSSSSTTTSTSTSPNDNSNEEGEEEEVGMKPSAPLRNLEIKANEVFESYTKLYYGKGNEVVSSVYFWDKDSSTSDSSSSNYQHHTSGRNSSRSSRSNSSRNNNNHNDHVFKKGFGGCFLIHKSINDVQEQQEQQQTGFWNSIHHVDFGPIVNGKSKYTLSTTILLSIDIMSSSTDNTVSAEPSTSSSSPVHRIGASLSKEVEKTLPIHNPTDHIINIGKIIEDVEIELRSNMDVLYIQKTKEVIDSIRPSTFVSNSYGSYRGRRSGSGSGSGIGSRGGGAGGMMMGGIPMLPPGAQNEMNAALMARFKKSNPS